MKKIVWTIYCLLIAVEGFSASLTNITIKVADETGLSIQDVKTTVIINTRDGQEKMEGLTDTNGLFSVQGGFPARIGIGGEKEGYYRSIDNLYFIPDEEGKGFEPWGGYTLILRKIIDPKKGEYGSTHSGKLGLGLDIPVFDKPVGFDVLESDWVAPYGKGKTADFAFTFSNDAEQKILSYVLTFSNKGDGIVEYPFDKKGQSIFRWPHKAPLNGYAPSTDRMTGYDRSKAIIPPGQKMRKQVEINYIFRVRTVFGDEGNIESALYGKITGEIGLSTKPKDQLRFSYWLNTDPHSRSMESSDPMFP